jgi:hypothetical protein
MAPKRKSDQVDLDLTVAQSVDESSQAVAPTKRARKSNTTEDPSTASTSETKGKEKSTKPQSWQELNLDGEDEVRNLITRFFCLLLTGSTLTTGKHSGIVRSFPNFFFSALTEHQ